MRMFEECPYITPCGFCSRKGKECEHKRKKLDPLPYVLTKQMNIPEDVVAKTFFGEKTQESEV